MKGLGPGLWVMHHQSTQEVHGDWGVDWATQGALLGSHQPEFTLLVRDSCSS